MTDPPALEVAFASDAYCFDGLAVALASVLPHTTGLAGSRIHVLDGGLADAQRRALLASRVYLLLPGLDAASLRRYVAEPSSAGLLEAA